MVQGGGEVCRGEVIMLRLLQRPAMRQNPVAEALQGDGDGPEAGCLRPACGKAAKLDFKAGGEGKQGELQVLPGFQGTGAG